MLMQSKLKTEYVAHFTKLRQIVSCSYPKYLITDNEISVITSFNECFPETRHFLCLTHFSNNVYTLLVQYNLSVKYASDSQFKLLINMCKCTVFLPDEYVNDTIINLQSAFALYKDFNISNYFNTFLCRYLEYNEGVYAKKGIYDAVYRLNNNIPLTTNTAEGYHSSFNYAVGFKTPSMIDFLKLQRETQAFSMKNIRELCIEPKIATSRRTLDKYERLRGIISRYEDYVGLDFLQTICEVYRWSH